MISCLFFVMFKGSNLAKPWPSYCEFPGVSWQVGPFPSWFEPLKDGGSRTTGARRCRLPGGGWSQHLSWEFEIHILKLIHNRSLGETMGPPENAWKSCWNLYTRDMPVNCRLLRQVCFLKEKAGPLSTPLEKLTCNLKMKPWKRRFLFGILPFSGFVWVFRGAHPGRLPWNLRIHPWKRKIIFQTIIFRFYVNLQGCISTGLL